MECRQKREALAHALQQGYFAVEVDGAYLQLDAAEAQLHLLFQPSGHLVEVAHPDEAVDGDAFLPGGKSRLQVEERGLQPEEDGGVGAQGVVVDAAFCFEGPAQPGQYVFVVR